MPGEGLTQLELAELGTPGEDQEEADQPEPDAGRGPGQQRQCPEGDQDPAEAAADRGGGRRGADHVPAAGPQRRSQQPPTVEGEGRDQVEAENEDVDQELVADQCPQGLGGPRWQRHQHDAEEGGDHRGHQRACGRVAELVGPASGRAPHFGHPAEQPEVDPLDRHPAAPGDDRMAELVNDDAREQEQGAGQAEQVGGSGSDAVDLLRVVAGAKRDRDQGHDQQPERADADRDSREVADSQAAAGHGPAPLRGIESRR